MDRLPHVYIGLGTNLGDRAAHLAAALVALEELLELDGVSGVYRSDAVGVEAQPFFWNAAVRGRTRLDPLPLLEELKRLERELGRVPSVRHGPRVIDLDLLLYDREVMETGSLTVPHAALMERPFVLAPLLELEPGIRHPKTGERLDERLARLGHAGAAERLGDASELLHDDWRRRMRRYIPGVAAVALVLGGCFDDIMTPPDPDIPDCVMPQADTTSWTRVTETVLDPGGMGAGARISYLIPPAFENTGERRWERNATLIGWDVGFGTPPALPYPDFVYSGSCRATISDKVVVLDYGGINSGGPNPDIAIIVGWQNVPLSGTSGTVIFHARMRDISDRPIIERMLWSVIIMRGAPPEA